ncbi:hypothetical protein BC938DRAFT_473006 [Jimgerdemannia flammicorona]|uniref:Arrestin C-terminal-like domain-containing protein n=1 Tax=Jimgerdemannia flammicorona TaxID=994334 RepID=A0A433Q4Y7_9FUNG|nr:hypothetical protein BC938DRAFT_473006 [Jimgerdemannia flammicorona]
MPLRLPSLRRRSHPGPAIPTTGPQQPPRTHPLSIPASFLRVVARKRSARSINNVDAPFRIELYLNAGFEQDGEPVYCPGSVIQGNVYLRLDEPICGRDGGSLKGGVVITGKWVVQLIWSSPCCVAENMSNDNGSWPGVHHLPDRYFAIRTFLWGSSKDGEHSIASFIQFASEPATTHWHTSTLYLTDLPKNEFQELSTGTHTFPFTIELPMINYSPTFDNRLFRSAMFLNATLERSYKFAPIQRRVLFHPFVETRTPKAPLLRHLNNPGFAVEAEFISQAYRPGDLITVHLHLVALPRYPVTDVRLRLVRCVKISYSDFSNIDRTIQQNVRLSTIFADLEDPLTVSLRVPSAAVPTVTTGQHLRIEYVLKLTLKTAGVCRPYRAKLEIPVTVGTLPNDVPAPAELKPYRKVPEGAGIERPRFLAQIEYETPLPMYEEERRPPSY